MLFLNNSFVFPRFNGTYTLAIFLVFPDNAPAPSVIGSAITSFSDQSAAITSSVAIQFPNYDPPVIATPEALNSSAVTSGKTKPNNLYIYIFLF